MKEISLLTNIIVYSGLFIALFYNVTDKQKRGVIKHLLLSISMLWMLFISVFLIKNFLIMCGEPLDVKLKVYETITNFIFLMYICYNIFDNHCKTQEKKKANTNLAKTEDPIGGGGIKNPKP